MKRQKTLLFLVLALVGLSLVGGVALAQGMGKGPDQWVLQKSEWPEGARIMSKPLEDHDFSGPPSLVNIAMQAEGFGKGYIVEGEYPCEFRNEAVRELVVEGPGVVGVLNIAYQFHKSAQATAQIEQAVGFIKQAAEREDVNQNQANIEYLELDSLVGDGSLAADSKMQGRVVRATWVEGDVEFVSHVFFGAQDRIFVFLAVHGFSDPTTQEVFETLLPKLLQR